MADRKVIVCARQINLDAFWSRAASTINNNLRSVEKILAASRELELLGLFISGGPMPWEDHCGCQITLGMVLASTKPGKHSASRAQFETIRNLRAAFGDFELSSSINADRNLTASSLGNTSKGIVRFPAASVGFRIFCSSCRSRMG